MLEMINKTMNFQTSIKTCFNKYATFSGRASRSEFWFFILFSILGGIITFIVDVEILGYSIDSEYSPINSIFSIVLLIPTIAVSCRRLHDINKSGWWQLLYFTIIGGILLIIWFAFEGEKKKNRFGPFIKIKK